MFDISDYSIHHLALKGIVAVQDYWLGRKNHLTDIGAQIRNIPASLGLTMIGTNILLSDGNERFRIFDTEYAFKRIFRRHQKHSSFTRAEVDKYIISKVGLYMMQHPLKEIFRSRHVMKTPFLACASNATIVRDGRLVRVYAESLVEILVKWNARLQRKRNERTMRVMQKSPKSGGIVPQRLLRAEQRKISKG